MRIPLWLAGLELVAIPLLAVAFARIMTRASERFRGHMTGWMIMSLLNGVWLGVFAFTWVWTYAELLDVLAASRLWLLLPFALLLVAGVVYVALLGRRLGGPALARTESLKPEPAMPNRRTLVEDLRDQLRYAELTERRTEDDIRRLEAELRLAGAGVLGELLERGLAAQLRERAAIPFDVLTLDRAFAAHAVLSLPAYVPAATTSFAFSRSRTRVRARPRRIARSNARRSDRTPCGSTVSRPTRRSRRSAPRTTARKS